MAMIKRPPLTLCGRMYVSPKDKDAKRTVEEGIERLIDFTTYTGYGAQVLLQLPPNFDDWKWVGKIAYKSIENGIEVELRGPLGVGGAFAAGMFNTFQDEVPRRRYLFRGLFDIDQWDPSKDENIIMVDELTDIMLKTDAVLGVGLRNKVRLAAEDYLDECRKVEEGITYYSFGPQCSIIKRNPSDIDLSELDEWYKDNFDPIPGFYLFFTGAEGYERVRYATRKSSLKANLAMYGGDPFVAIRTSYVSPSIVGVYGVVEDQPPPLSFNPDTFNKKAKELVKTDIGEVYVNTANDPNVQEELKKYFREESVKEVVSRINEGAKEGIKELREEYERIERYYEQLYEPPLKIGRRFSYL